MFASGVDEVVAVDGGWRVRVRCAMPVAAISVVAVLSAVSSSTPAAGRVWHTHTHRDEMVQRG